MPISSTHISGLVGGQQVMFANQATYAQQVGGVYGTGPATPASLQNPFPSYADTGYGVPIGGETAGASSAGMVGMVLPSAITGASIAGGLMGGRAAWLDPFTGVGRAFRAGSGALPGAGIGSTLGHVRSAFTAGGARAGLGALGGGLAAGAAMAIPYALAGAAVQEVGGQIYQGAESFQDVTRLAAGFGPSYGIAGTRPGGRLPRQQIRQMVTVLEDLASQDVMQSVGSLTRLVGQFQQMGMLTGVTDVTSFKRRFSEMVQQVNSVAAVMGTSLEEAAPMLQNMRQMGLWRPQDIMGTAMAARMVGRQAAPQMMQAMQVGAQTSWQMGGDLRAGALAARGQFTTLESALRTGSIRDEDIMQMTGGVGGTRGLQLVAQQNVQLMSQLGRTPMGRLMTAGLAETQEGRFTGRLDPELMEQFRAGSIDIGELTRRGRSQTGTRRGVATFTANQQMLSQELTRQIGTSGIGQMIEQMMSRAGFDEKDEDLQRIFMQKTMGMSERQAKFWSGILQDMPKIQEQEARRARDAIEDQFRRVDERMNRSYQGFKDALSHQWENAWRPFREYGTNMSQRFTETLDQFSDWFWDRRQPIRVGAEERMRMLTTGSGLTDLPDTGQGRLDLGTPIVELIRRGGTSRRETLMQMPGAVVRRGQGRPGEILLGQPSGSAAIGMGSSFLGTAETEGVFIQEDLARQGVRRTRMRAQLTSSGSAGFTRPGDESNLQALKQEINLLVRRPDINRKLREYKDKYRDSPLQYTREALKLIKGSSPVAERALKNLHKSSGAGMFEHDELDALKVVSDEVLWLGGVGIEGAFSGAAAQVGGIGELDPAALTQMQEEGQRTIESALEDGWLSRVAGPVIGGAVTAGTLFTLGVLAPTAGSVVSRAIGGLFGNDIDIAPEQVTSAVMEEEWGSDFARLVQAASNSDLQSAIGQQIEAGNKFLKASEEEGSSAQQLYSALLGMDDDRIGKLASGIRSLTTVKGSVVATETAERRRQLAKREVSRVGAISEKWRGRYRSILEDISKGNFSQQDVAFQNLQNLSEEMAGTKSGRQQLGRISGAFGAQMRAFARVGQLQAGVSPEKLRRQISGLEDTLGSGIIDPFRKDIEKMLEDEVVSSGDISKIKKMLGGAVSRAGATESASGMRTTANILDEQLSKYTELNTKFVIAATAAISKIQGGDESDMMKSIEQGMKKYSTSGGATPP